MTCAFYSPLTDTWSKAQHRPNLMHKYGPSIVWGDKVLLLGGGYAGGTYEVEEMNVAGGPWKNSNITLPKGLWCHHAVLLDLPKKGVKVIIK